MADLGPSRATTPTLWHRLGKPITRRLDMLHQRLARRREAEVFPWLEHWAAAAAILGASLGFGTGWACHLEMNGLIYGSLLGATVGALVGIGLALSWAVDAPSAVASPAAGAIDLWDPWLDENDEEATAAQPPPPVDECAAEIREERVLIRPRVVSSESDESVPLEAEIGPFLANHDRGAIGISGPPGSGKSSALIHLARRLPPHFQVAFLDEPHPSALADAAERGLVVFAMSGPGRPTLLADFTLAPWGKDEWIEYLLGADRSRCGSVMARLERRDAEHDLLEGIPDLWQIVLDRMAADESIGGPREALRIELGRHLADRELREQVEGVCVVALLVRKQSYVRVVDYLRRHCPDDALVRLIRHRTIQLLLAADRLADELTRGAVCDVLARPLPRDLVQETALRIADRPEAVAHLKRLIADAEESRHPMVASLLHALRVDWKPDQPPPCLKGAYLEEAAWAGVELSGADLRNAELSRAYLWGARLDRTLLDDARLAGADFRTASLDAARLDRADLSRARLARVQARHTHFESACLRAADLESALLDGAKFLNADLGGARLVAASLVGANLSAARFDGADFTGANLSRAVLPGRMLSRARFENARFTGANLSRCNLEGMELPDAFFAEADLSHALLTSSCMPGADFRNADLHAAGLAEVDWERADLRNADLREAAFHLGSSRSGLVGSTVPCEGSRTGFYTDEYNEQDFKSPEEIRKASLRGADLRGALIDGVDFYLVDLRGARLDPDQVLHLRRCGAILESRA
jgi:uncharacterized protein YjbI with pentapeptide repeats